MTKTPSYIQQTSTFNAINNIATNDIQLRAQFSSVITDLTNIINKVNIHERQISLLVSGTM